MRYIVNTLFATVIVTILAIGGLVVVGIAGYIEADQLHLYLALLAASLGLSVLALVLITRSRG